jgi:hypothetical protein
MSALVRCRRCRRHVLAKDAACPFCARAGKAAVAVVTGAVILTSFGCAYGAPDRPDRDRDADAADAAAEGGSDAGDGG